MGVCRLICGAKAEGALEVDPAPPEAQGVEWADDPAIGRPFAVGVLARVGNDDGEAKAARDPGG